MPHGRHSPGEELLAFGRELAAAGAAQVGGSFTDDPAADALVRESPVVFLLGVLFTQGIPAERAWAGPYLLRERLGHLDLERLAAEEDAIARAVAHPPALHRFIYTLPKWIASAARRVLTEYGGRVEAIWAPGSHVLDVTDRLLAFEGIGEKKAAMAVEILMRHFGVPLVGEECGNVAYDVHVRRVFLRTGLVDHDTLQAVQDAARAVCGEAPGTLDLATWLVGREWCRPREPRCEECRLGRSCPRLTDRAVDGVGVKR
jgi:uncharacterized HhH-GPD family protein